MQIHLNVGCNLPLCVSTFNAEKEVSVSNVAYITYGLTFNCMMLFKLLMLFLVTVTAATLQFPLTISTAMPYCREEKTFIQNSSITQNIGWLTWGADMQED